MSHADLAQETRDAVLQAAKACGMRDAEVRLVAVNPVSTRDQRDVEAAVSGMVGRPCSVTVTEVLELEVPGARCRVGVSGVEARQSAVESALRGAV